MPVRIAPAHAAPLDHAGDVWNTAPVAAARVSPRPTLPGCWYDAAAAEAAVQFFTWYCRFTAGAKAGQPFALEPWQAWIVRQLFGWKRADGIRLYQRLMLWVPRGNGKTEMMSALALLALVALGGVGTEIHAIAATETQARISFRGATSMAAQSPDLGALIEPRKTSLYCPATDSVFIPLTAKPTGKHGLRTRVMLGDEMHEWGTGDLYDFVAQAMVKWPDPLQLLISTAGKPHGFGYTTLWEESTQICDGVIDDPTTLVVIYAADPAKDDLADPAVWRRVNPNWGVSIDPEVITRKIQRGLVLPSEKANVMRYHLNIWSGVDVQRAIQPATWALNTTRPADATYWRDLEDELAGRPCIGGLDTAVTRDLNALVWLFPPAGSDTSWTILPRFWWPREAVEAQRNQARIPVDSWEAMGALTITPGNAADHKAIERQIHADCEKFQVQKLGIDAWNSHQLLTDLMAAGVPIEITRFGMQTIAPIWKRFDLMLAGGEFEHGNHPVLRWNADGVVLRAPDDNGNTMPTRRRSTAKIDGIAATLIALAMAQSASSTGSSYYLTEGLTVL